MPYGILFALIEYERGITMKKIIATNFILVLFLVCFMVGGVNAGNENDNGSNGNVTNSFTGTFQVPEPSSLLMLGSGLIGLCALVKKIKNK